MARGVAFGSHNLEFAIRRERLIVLRDLITLRQVGIEVILAREDRLLIDPQTKRECGPRAELNGAPV